MDEIIWKLIPHNEYTAKSAYALQFLGSRTTEYKKTNLETLGNPKMQVVRLASHPKQTMDLRRTASAGLAEPGHMPTLQTITESDLVSLFGVQVHPTSVEFDD